ncbi:hypothetical protein PS015_23910, partial [Shigella sonnei]|nr:hypothetical protein [Shigella sonnei]
DVDERIEELEEKLEEASKVIQDLKGKVNTVESWEEVESARRVHTSKKTNWRPINLTGLCVSRNEEIDRAGRHLVG